MLLYMDRASRRDPFSRSPGAALDDEPAVGVLDSIGDVGREERDREREDRDRRCGVSDVVVDDRDGNVEGRPLLAALKRSWRASADLLIL